jgi:orotate phosphoribosyltransferase
MTRTKEEWIEVYQQKGALWIHDGNPVRPHALLTSGKHSNGFFNSRIVISDEVLLNEAASDLLELLNNTGEAEGIPIHVVVGPQTGATKLAELLSKEISLSYTGEGCSWASPAKKETEGKKSMVFSEEELWIMPDEYVLLCEDVLTTGGSVELADKAVTDAGGIALPLILTLVNRSGLKMIGGKMIIALIDHPMPMWESDECPLCKGGSEAIRPKGEENWALLNQKY